MNTARPDFFPASDMMRVGVYYYPEHWPEEQWERDFANMAANMSSLAGDHGTCCASAATARADNASAVAGVNEGVAGTKTRELFIDFEALGIFPPTSVGITQNLQCLDIVGIAPDNPFQKTNFHIQIPQFLTREFFPRAK